MWVSRVNFQQSLYIKSALMLPKICHLALTFYRCRRLILVSDDFTEGINNVDPNEPPITEFKCSDQL